MSEAYKVVVCDFGIAQVMALAGVPRLHRVCVQMKAFVGGGGGTGQRIGSPFYMAPELLLDKDWDRSVDVYAYGVTVWEVYTRSAPYPEYSSMDELVDAVAVGGERPALPPQCPPPLAALLQQCWAKDAARRPDFTHILDRALLDAIIVDDLCPEPAANGFWKAAFLARTPNDAYGARCHRCPLLTPLSVPFNDFMLAFGAHFKARARAASLCLGVSPPTPAGGRAAAAHRRGRAVPARAHVQR